MPLQLRQLFYDGHQQLALNLSQTLGLSQQPPPPSDKLFRLVSVAKQFVDDPEVKEKTLMQVNLNGWVFIYTHLPFQRDYEGTGLDLEYDADIVPSSPEPVMYETIYITSHKAP